MRTVNLQGIGLIRDQAARDAIREIEKASAEVDLITIAQAFTTDVPFEVADEVRELNVTTPSLANIAAVLATFLADCKRGGQHRTT